MNHAPAFTVPGHTLVERGNAHDAVGVLIPVQHPLRNTYLYGFAKCSCGALSPDRLTNNTKRREWHYEHKFEVDPDRATAWFMLKDKWLKESFWENLTPLP